MCLSELSKHVLNSGSQGGFRWGVTELSKTSSTKPEIRRLLSVFFWQTALEAYGKAESDFREHLFRLSLEDLTEQLWIKISWAFYRKSVSSSDALWRCGWRRCHYPRQAYRGPARSALLLSGPVAPLDQSLPEVTVWQCSPSCAELGASSARGVFMFELMLQCFLGTSLLFFFFF